MSQPKVKFPLIPLWYRLVRLASAFCSGSWDGFFLCCMIHRGLCLRFPSMDFTCSKYIWQTYWWTAPDTKICSPYIPGPPPAPAGPPLSLSYQQTFFACWIHSIFWWENICFFNPVQQCWLTLFSLETLLNDHIQFQNISVSLFQEILMTVSMKKHFENELPYPSSQKFIPLPNR